MPKKPKPQPKKPLKTKQKIESKPVTITSRKSYWIVITVFMVVFGIFYGYSTKVAVTAIAIMIASVLSVIAFAYYLRFEPSTVKTKTRAIYLFVGASIIGFLIWFAVILLIKAVGFEPQIANSIGDEFFLITSFVIFLAFGAFIGDLIGKNKDALRLSFHKTKNKLFRIADES